MKVIIIGAGGISYQHAEACRQLEAVELTAVCDVKREAADALADKYDVKARYDDLDKLLAAESADVAVVATWGRYHADVTARLARSGKVRGILCEKPLAMDANEAAEMARVARERGVLLAEAFRLRHQPIHFRAIELLRSGRIGEVRHVRNAMMSITPPDRRRPELNWRFNKPAGGGVTFDIGCYAINHIRWALDAEPETVHAIGRWGEASQVDEHVVAHATFPGGQTAEWCVSWQAGPRHAAEVYGTTGMLRLERAWGIDEQGPTAIEIVGIDGSREVEELQPVRQFQLQLAHIRDVLATGGPHRLPPSDSIAQMAVIDAVYESLRTGQVARVKVTAAV